MFLKSGRRVRGKVLSDEAGKPLTVEVERNGLKKVVAFSRDRIRFVRLLSTAHQRLQDEARAELAKGDLERGVVLLTRLAEALPNDAQAQRELGFALLLKNEDERAEQVLRRATELDPEDFAAQLQLAQVLERLERRDEAIQAYRAATARDPRHAVSWRALARLLMERQGPGDRKLALSGLSKAASADPRNEGVCIDRAEILLESGNADEREEARRLLVAFVKDNPGAPIARSLLASLHAGDGDFAAAKRELDEVLKRVPAGAPDRDWLEAERALYAWEEGGRQEVTPPGLDVAEAGEQAPRTLHQLNVLVELRPGDGGLLLARARAEVFFGRIKVARTWLEQAALAGPEAVTQDALIVQNVASALQSANLIPGIDPPRTFLGKNVSVAKAKRLVRLLGWLPQSYETLAAAYARAGKKAEAAAAYRSAALRLPPGEAAAAERARLEAAATRASQ